MVIRYRLWVDKAYRYMAQMRPRRFLSHQYSLGSYGIFMLFNVRTMLINNSCSFFSYRRIDCQTGWLDGFGFGFHWEESSRISSGGFSRSPSSAALTTSCVVESSDLVDSLDGVCIPDGVVMPSGRIYKFKFLSLIASFEYRWRRTFSFSSSPSSLWA